MTVFIIPIKVGIMRWKGFGIKSGIRNKILNRDSEMRVGFRVSSWDSEIKSGFWYERQDLELKSGFKSRDSEFEIRNRRLNQEYETEIRVLNWDSEMKIGIPRWELGLGDKSQHRDKLQTQQDQKQTNKWICTRCWDEEIKWLLLWMLVPQEFSVALAVLNGHPVLGGSGAMSRLGGQPRRARSVLKTASSPSSCQSAALHQEEPHDNFWNCVEHEKQDGRLTCSMVAVGESRGDQRTLREQDHIQTSPHLNCEVPVNMKDHLTPKLWLKPVLGAGLAALR